MNQATCQPVHSPNVSVESRFTINNAMQKTHQMMHVTHQIDHSTQDREYTRQECERTRERAHETTPCDGYINSSQTRCVLYLSYETHKKLITQSCEGLVGNSLQQHSMSSTSCMTGVGERHSAFVKARYASTAARMLEHC